MSDDIIDTIASAVLYDPSYTREEQAEEILDALCGAGYEIVTTEEAKLISDAKDAVDVPHPELDGLTPREAAVNKFQCVACERALERLGSEWL